MKIQDCIFPLCFHRTGKRLCPFMRQIMSIWVSVVLKNKGKFKCMFRILKSYRKKTKHLCVPAEVASLLIRNVSYEGPALRKQLAKAKQLQQELSRREVECQSSAAELRERYYAACKQYGIRVSTATSTPAGDSTKTYAEVV